MRDIRQGPENGQGRKITKENSEDGNKKIQTEGARNKVGLGNWVWA